MSALAQTQVFEEASQYPDSQSQSLFPAALNNHNGTPTPREPQSLKRKREHNPDDFYQSFQVLPCPHSHLDTPITITPHFLLPRPLLSLSCIDNAPKSSPLPQSRFFSAYIPVLEDDQSPLPHESQTSQLLIASIQQEKEVWYVIEKLKLGVYAFCRLGSWVNIPLLKRQASLAQVSSPPQHKTQATLSSGDQWWKPAIVGTTSFSKDAAGKRRKTEESQIVSQQTSKEDAPDGRSHTSIPVDNTLSPQQPPPDEHLATPQQHGIPTNAPISIGETYTNITQHYLESLYLSGASLAYFAKGPLSKARVAHGHSEDLPELAQFLRGLILTVSLTDKRYKQTIPSTLKSCTAAEDFGGSGGSADAKKKRSRRTPKGTKRSKDGLLPGEADVMSKWWNDDDSSLQVGSSVEACLALRLPHLRFRETLLQIILILETLAIEETTSEAEQISKDSPPATAEYHPTQPDETIKGQPKVKKPKDLNALADSLVDRLTIWQSIEPADDRARRNREATSGDVDTPQDPLGETSSDKMKEFGTEIVVPFYGSRLPSLVNRLSEKMGLPAMSPLRSKRSDKDTTQRLAPGTAISRNRPTDRSGGKSLSRVNSEASRKATLIPPSLLRSATDSSLQHIKRERSNTPQSDRQDSRPPSRNSTNEEGKPGKDCHRRSLSRANSMSQSNKAFNQREVDLSAITKHNEAKLKKKVNVEKELQDAIATLKKPNRGMAVKPVADETDARHSVLNKPNATAIKRTHLGVQVNATPKRLSKTKSFVGNTPKRASYAARSPDPDLVPSTNPCVPASVSRPGASLSSQRPWASLPDLHTPTKASKRTFAVSATPVPSKTSKARSEDFSSAVVDSVKKPRPSDPFLTPVKAGQAITRAPSSKSNASVAVPSKPASVKVTIPQRASGPALLASKTKENRILPTPTTSGSTEPASKSIYETLGWDDDHDELM